MGRKGPGPPSFDRAQGAWAPLFWQGPRGLGPPLLTALNFSTHFNKLALYPCTLFVLAQFRQTLYFDLKV